MLKLRDYQERAVKVGVDFLCGAEKGGAIIVAPTAAGKSIYIASIANALTGNTLVLQPSLEILEQNIAKANSLGINDIGVYSASASRKDIGKLTFATIGSIIRKKELFSDFQHLIIDECHAVNAKGGMYEELITFMGGKVLGLTATPYRLHAYSDFRTGELSVVAKFLHRTRPRLFSKIIDITQVGYLYEKGYLCPITYANSGDYKHSDIKLNTTGMDFDEVALASYNKEHSIIEKIASIIYKKESKHYLVFSSSVDEASDLSDYLKLKGISSAIISAKTNKKDRAEILRKFKAGEIDVVTNFGTLTTGFDFPELDCVILGRPTQSVALYYQMSGRGIRVADEKQCVKMIDMCGNVSRFGRIETFEIVEESPNMHRLKSNVGFLTGYCFYNNRDLEAIDYAGQKETVFAKKEDVVQFGAHKGTHITKIPNGYLDWGVKTLTGNWQKSFIKEQERRRESIIKKTKEDLPF